MATPRGTGRVEGRRRRKSLGVIAAAAAIPLLSHAAALFMNIGADGWFNMSPAVRWSLAADAMLYTAGSTIVAGPVIGVAAILASRFNRDHTGPNHDGVRAASVIGMSALLFAIVSAVLSMAWRAGQPGVAAIVLQSHVTMAAVVCALMAWGALCGTWFREPLDAAACSVAFAVSAAAGLLVAGAVVADMPSSVLGWGLIASPLVVVASAAHIDIARTDLLYQISPLAHIQFDYPTWGRASALYLAVAFVCFVGVTLKSRAWCPGVRDLRGLP